MKSSWRRSWLLRSLGARAQPQCMNIISKRSYHHRPHDNKSNLDVLSELEMILQQDPNSKARLSSLLSGPTARNLTSAINAVHHHNQKQLQQQQRTGTPAVAAVPVPSMQELRIVALHYGLPFIGFGFVDNAIMILAGDYIDLTLGVSLGISSMAAAGIGNTISDIAGLGLGNMIEDLCARVGIPVPMLTPAQQALKQTRMAKVIGSSIGVTIGCLLGMTPLLFLETREDHQAAPKNDSTNEINKNIVSS